ncbi:hypothetical protein [Burkholderia lata]|nr:hypothetical protein [Burkholderia lata]
MVFERIRSFRVQVCCDAGCNEQEIDRVPFFVERIEKNAGFKFCELRILDIRSSRIEISHIPGIEMFVPPRIEGSSVALVRTLADEKRMKIPDVFWRVLAKASDGAQYAKVDLMAANAVMMIDSIELKDKLTEHAFTENHGGRWVRLVAEERGGEHRKILISHAEDEERHGMLFLKLLRDLGHYAPDEMLGPPDYIDPYYMDLHEKWGGDLYRFMCFIHAAEVRTMFYVQHVLHITAAFNDPLMSRLNDTFSAIYNDEKFHIRYSAHLLGGMMDAGRDPDVLRAAFDEVHQQTANTIRTLIGNYNRKEI